MTYWHSYDGKYEYEIDGHDYTGWYRCIGVSVVV